MINYFEIEPEQNTFKTLSVQTTYKCQKACSNCYLGNMLNNEKLPDVNIDMLAGVLSKLPFRTDIRFIGAEPTMNPNLFELLKIARKYGHRPSLLTNGLKLRKESYVKELKKSGLNMLGISMNGGLDNDVYQEFDNGKYAKQKMIALENCFKNKILPHINTIIDPTNIHVLPPLIEYIESLGYIGPKFPVMLRLKSIGQLGNYRKTHTYSLEEMINIVEELGGEIMTNSIDGYDECNSVLWKKGNLLGKITDWSIDDDGVPDSGSTRRGILLDNGKIAPFFEFYKEKDNAGFL